eukprot:14946576-Alexandrium_andersonii.AAC.1
MVRISAAANTARFRTSTGAAVPPCPSRRTRKAGPSWPGSSSAVARATTGRTTKHALLASPTADTPRTTCALSGLAATTWKRKPAGEVAVGAWGCSGSGARGAAAGKASGVAGRTSSAKESASAT